MNKKLIVTLLHKNVEELAMITASFQEQDSFSQAIIQLASRKTEDIQTLLGELAAIQTPILETAVEIDVKATPVVQVVDELDVAECCADIPEVDVCDVESVKQEFTSSEIAPVNEPDEVLETVFEEALLSNIHINDLPDLTFAPSDQVLDDDLEVEIPSDETAMVVLELPVNDEIITSLPQEVDAEEPKKMTISEKLAMQTTRNEAFAHGDNSLSASIANKKITDIKQAISIGDRFRFQRELFKSNGEDMNRTLTYLNLLATHDEALSFLKSKYSWDESSEAASDFHQLVKRKFV